jgi:hypothetical protein
VATGGGLIVFDRAGSNGTALLNTLFGYGLTAGPGGGPYKKSGEVAGTAFATGPASLPDNDATDSLDTATLPSGAAAMYANGASAAVVAFSVGTGEVVFLGWDWFDAAPAGTQNGGWLLVYWEWARDPRGSRAASDPLLAALVDLLLPERHRVLERVDRLGAGSESVLAVGR